MQDSLVIPKEVRVELGSRSYSVYIGKGLLRQAGPHFVHLGLKGKVMIVTNPFIKELYGETLRESLVDAGYDVFFVEIPEGEKYKSLSSAQTLYDQAFQNGLDRKSTIVALGGGVIGDLAGFIAATYMRGLNFVQIPTTLLAQVDSSVGGKVAVNHPLGKNIIGAFYQPRMVLADIDTLKTLPEREFRAGMAEVIKYGVIWDKDFFNFLLNSKDNIKTLSNIELLKIIERSCAIKAEVVAKDETEQSVRAILNYGHTFGHAYEALTNYNTYVHGEAVAIGMITAAQVGVQLGLLNEMDKKHIVEIVQAYGLPDSFGTLDLDEIIESMGHDKKAEGGKIRYVIPDQIGKVRLVDDISHDILVKALRCQLG